MPLSYSLKALGAFALKVGSTGIEWLDVIGQLVKEYPPPAREVPEMHYTPRQYMAAVLAHAEESMRLYGSPSLTLRHLHSASPEEVNGLCRLNGGDLFLTFRQLMDELRREEEERAEEYFAAVVGGQYFHGKGAIDEEVIPSLLTPQERGKLPSVMALLGLIHASATPEARRMHLAALARKAELHGIGNPVPPVPRGCEWAFYELMARGDPLTTFRQLLNGWWL